MAFERRKCLYGFEKGQVLLVAVLVIVIALTVGLSLVARTITNLRISTEEAQSQKALAAAEAGIERVLQSNQQGVTVEATQTSPGYVATKTNIGGSGTGIVLNGGNPALKDEGVDVWFEAHDVTTGNLNGVFTAPSNLRIYWGSSSVCANSAAIEVIIVTINAAGTVKTRRFAYDSCSSRGNNFTTTPTVAVGSFPITSGSVTSTFANRVTVDVSSITGGDNIVFMRVIPLYKDSIIGVSNNNPLPLQGYQIDSTGTSGEASRKIRVFKGYPQTPLVYMSYGLFVPCDDANCN